ncbi:eukaryotic translation initiation factor 4E transporter [Schistosoma bovis]|uniref:Eukaryotic translation initiation factor 4E transporter n=1 Tax=Schistosoma bovis TaxID=6184 RepID=A0A430QA38_SCHBO|nr:eukaryotic translation initiation factor 4E transporter [Schistosoma bovis]
MGERKSNGQCESKSCRIHYTREEILAVKENAVSTAEFSDEFSRINASVMRSTRGRPRPNSFSKTQGGEKTRDASNIVLGPQKRSWNTGCHVSQQPQGRETSDANNSTRWPKFNSENRSYDKQHCKTTSDYKREYRSNDIRGSGRGRDRGLGKHAESAPFVKNHSREDRYSHDRRISCSHSDDEPEWFAEGPTTVNETIELGGILEETVECGSLRKCLGVENDISQVDDSILTNSSISNRNVFDDKALEDDSNAFPEQPSKSTTSVTDQVMSDNQGSRFKHLFQKNEISDENKLPNKPASLDNINEQLLRLLKGPCGNSASHLSPEKNSGMVSTNPNSFSTLQVENKLRSILLGHGPVNSPNVGPVKESKPAVLTVEEIEAQLKLPQGDSADINISIDPIVDPLTHYSDPFIDDQAIKSRGIPIGSSKNCSLFSQSGTTSNLVPILQSLMIRKQQNSVYSQSTNPQNSHSHFGLVSNFMVITAVLLNLSLGLYPDASRFQTIKTPDSGLPGRPIVKAQQNIFADYNSNKQAPNSTFNNNQSHLSVNPSVHQDSSHRLLDMNVKQFYLGSTEPSNLNNSHGSLPCSKQNYGNLLPFQSSSPSLASSINWNKNSSAQHQTKVNESLTSNGSLTLLSQLVEWEKSKQPLRSNPSFNPTKAKTLEEIEQAESSRTNIFF